MAFDTRGATSGLASGATTGATLGGPVGAGVGAGIGALLGGFGSKKKKFRGFQAKSIGELINETRGAFASNQSGFLSDQIQAQRENFGTFFDQRDATVQAGQSLIDKLSTGDLERRLSTQSIRGAQAARGLSLGPAAAIQEGLHVAEAQRGAEMQALQLGQGLAQFSAATPLQLQQLDFSQMLSTAQQSDLAQAGLSTNAQISNINMQRDREAQSMALFGKAIGGLNKDMFRTPGIVGEQTPTSLSSGMTTAGQSLVPGRGPRTEFDNTFQGPQVFGMMGNQGSLGTSSGSAFNSPASALNFGPKGQGFQFA